MTLALSIKENSLAPICKVLTRHRSARFRRRGIQDEKRFHMALIGEQLPGCNGVQRRDARCGEVALSVI